ncbi:T9SS type A sorting domain-containing protein [Flavobacteriaceae bacterium]|nr:T9SS type A sorting domain-containing protein [Flavobacteriaceae bacterium]
MRKLQLAFLLASSFSFSQTLTLSENSSIVIDSNSSLSVDGLELAPNEAYTISGPNTLDRSNVPVVVGDNTSVSRVYELSAELSDYSGTLNFSYLESELNSILEADLVLEVQDVNGDWTAVSASIDEANKTLSYDFTELVGFTSVTASDESATLTVKPVLLDGYVRVYPNPTTDFLHIVSNTAQKATLFNTAGQKILETNNATALDVIDLPSGVYLLNLQNTQNQISTFKIIKK